MQDVIKKNKIQSLIGDIQVLIAAADQFASKYQAEVDRVHPKYRESALNLLHYCAIRSRDLTRVQKRLKNLGLSRLAKAESHMMPSLLTTLSILRTLDHEESHEFQTPDISIKKTKRRLKTHVRNLLGKRPKKRESRIMVTMPTRAATDINYVRSLLTAGMNVARINCAHDDSTIWKDIADNIRVSSAELGIPCAISMDLAGPKIRTGQIESGPQIKKVRPSKNPEGMIIAPARVWFGNTNYPQAAEYIPIQDTSKLTAGMTLHFRDTRTKARKIQIEECNEHGCWALVDRTAYFESGMLLYHEEQLIHQMCMIGRIPANEGSIFLRPGDHLQIVKEPIVAVNRTIRSTSDVPARIHCSNAAALNQARKGESVMLDDGKFAGVIIGKNEHGITIEIRTVRKGGAKLRADKGINFPDSNLRIEGLTQKDREDLKFIAKHADIVNMSFVNSAKDVNSLLDALDDCNAPESLGVVLKIETLRAFKNLLPIILAGMQAYPLGVMIARGDLAIEVGWNKLAIAQREIMKLCHAAHVPDIWATQVFENLAKTGIPSRAEMTDVWVAQRSECVMLNKGPFIIEAIELLDSILTKMDIYHDKDSALLPSIKKISR